MSRKFGMILLAMWVMFAGMSCDQGQGAREELETMVPENQNGNGERIALLNVQTGQTEDVARIEKSADQWREKLTKEQFHIAREKGTERAFTGKYHDTKGKGFYECVACGTDLYCSEAKFDSGSGWPSFTQAVAPDNIQTKVDTSSHRERIEVMCGRCGAHLGHIFDDGPKPTGMRHCINSAVLQFVEEKEHYDENN